MFYIEHRFEENYLIFYENVFVAVLVFMLLNNAILVWYLESQFINSYCQVLLITVVYNAIIALVIEDYGSLLKFLFQVSDFGHF